MEASSSFLISRCPFCLVLSSEIDSVLAWRLVRILERDIVAGRNWGDFFQRFGVHWRLLFLSVLLAFMAFYIGYDGTLA
jgi:hypothetical protein